jgi:DNA-binding beta-propeller fold protein YncE
MAVLPLVLLTMQAPLFGQAAKAATPVAASGEHYPIHLPTSKMLYGDVPGSPERINSLPMGIAWSPDHRYLAVVNAGYGTAQSNYEQSIAVLDTKTGKITDNPDPRFVVSAAQTLYNGIAFSSDGKELYVSADSLSAPEKQDASHTGNGVLVYRVNGGKLTAEREIYIPLQKLADGRTQNPIGHPVAPGMAISAPTGLAVVKTSHGDELLVADEFSDDALLMDAASGKILHRFDLADHSFVPSTYPISVAVSRDGRRGWVGLWNASEVAELDLTTGRILGKLALQPPKVDTGTSSHPVSLALSRNGRMLYVALANRDDVAQVSLHGDAMRVERYFSTRLPGQIYFGAIPDCVAVSPDGKTLYVADMGGDDVAVIHPFAKHPVAGFIPTEWLTTAVAVDGSDVYIATGKGKGTGPNDIPQAPAPHPSPFSRFHSFHSPDTYIPTLLHGSLATLSVQQVHDHLAEYSRETIKNNMMKAEQKHIVFTVGGHPIKHVIYIIKENRTYDQILGDLGAGNGDPALTMYGWKITPNEHRLALQFGVLDNFYDSGEVSGDGHVWSNAAITTDYTEYNWQQGYRSSERLYDFEGVVENRIPLKEGISNVDTPESGYIWGDLAAHHKTLYHFAEFISSTYCNAKQGQTPRMNPRFGTPEPMHYCKRPYILKGQQIPAMYGGGISKYPWKIPLLYKNTATMPQLVGHFDPHYPDFGLSFPDQLRVNEFLRHFRKWVAAVKAGKPDPMADFVQLRLPNDHTAGTQPGMPTPQASVADNDLAVGRVVDAISHSPYWNNTAILILEDDAQNGADHVDAHRSIAFVISKYSPRLAKPVVDSTFYTTASMLHTAEDLMEIPPMNNNDAFAPVMEREFEGNGNQPPYNADYRNEKNGLIYTANTKQSFGAQASLKMDFQHEDKANPAILNVILWKQAMGNKPVPARLEKAYLEAMRSKNPYEAKDDDK